MCASLYFFLCLNEKRGKNERKKPKIKQEKNFGDFLACEKLRKTQNCNAAHLVGRKKKKKLKKMATLAKKIRAFEADNLTREEKHIATLIRKRHKYSSTTAPYKFYLLKQFCMGIGIVNMLLSGNQIDVLYIILNYLTTKEFVKVAAACSNEKFLTFFWYPKSKPFQKFLQEKRETNIFHNNGLPSTEHLKKIKTGKDLLTNYYQLEVPKTKWKIDTSKMLPTGYNIDCLAFNPVHPLLGIMMSNKIYIIAYGGKVRAERGQILFATNPNPPTDLLFGINWSPGGTYLLVIQGELQSKISIFHYDSNFFSVSEISFFPNENLEAGYGLNTKFLWLNDSSFIFATTEKYQLCTVKLDGKEKNYKTKIIEVNKSLSMVHGGLEKKFLHFISGFFVMPNEESNYIYFLSSCGKDHQHHRILYIDKITLDVVKWVNLPGEVLEITVSENEFFVLIQQRLEESYFHLEPSITEKKDNMTKEFCECSFSEPWRQKKSSTTSDIAKIKIVTCTEQTAHYFRQKCCSDQITGISSTISYNTNLNYAALRECLTKVVRSNMLYSTKDYLYCTSISSTTTTVFGKNHHFSFQVKNTEDFLFPNQTNLAWFHPSKPIFIQKNNLFYFNIYLQQTANEEDQENFPLMRCFNYKAQSLFKPIDLL